MVTGSEVCPLISGSSTPSGTKRAKQQHLAAWNYSVKDPKTLEAPGKSNRRKPKRVQTLGRAENFWKERERDHRHLKKPGVSANVLNHSYFMDGPNGKKWST